ncbi:MAG: hypothetical protein IPM46_09610 [Flavobacteriales bacterium]|nr:hypothetical protein [Flavobacteriales bacterium]
MYIFAASTQANCQLRQGEYNAKAIGKAKAFLPVPMIFMVEGEEGIAPARC